MSGHYRNCAMLGVLTLAIPAASAAQQPAGQTGQNESQTACAQTSATGTCEEPTPDPHQAPRRWLKGRAAFNTPGRPSTGYDPVDAWNPPRHDAYTMAAYAAAMRKPLSATRGEQGSTTVAVSANDSGAARSAHDYLVEEWRRSELDVADSVHHAILERIVSLYDSAQGASVSTSDRDRMLRIVDVMNQQNQWSWETFRATINNRADSALTRGELP